MYSIKKIEEVTLYTKLIHGAYPVTVSKGGYELKTPQKKYFFKSKRQLMIHLYKGKDLHLPFDRYFRLGKYASKVLAGPSLFDFMPKKIKLGIDLQKRSHEVAKLLYAGFGKKIYAGGLDPQEVLQEVYKGILARNKGKCPYDPAKSSFSHYVYMVIGCILNNYQRSHIKRKESESVGINSFQEGKWESTDVAASDKAVAFSPEEESVVADFIHYLESTEESESLDCKNAIKLVPYLCEGYTRKEIAEQEGLKLSQIARAVKLLRSISKEWFGLPLG